MCSTGAEQHHGEVADAVSAAERVEAADRGGEQHSCEEDVHVHDHCHRPVFVHGLEERRAVQQPQSPHVHGRRDARGGEHTRDAGMEQYQQGPPGLPGRHHPEQQGDRPAQYQQQRSHHADHEVFGHVRGERSSRKRRHRRCRHDEAARRDTHVAPSRPGVAASAETICREEEGRDRQRTTDHDEQAEQARTGVSVHDDLPSRPVRYGAPAPTTGPLRAAARARHRSTRGRRAECRRRSGPGGFAGPCG